MRAILFALGLFVVLAEHAYAERRVALVVGNGAYEYTVPLANPRNDAQDIAAALSGLGFQVISGTDLDKRSLDLKVREFSHALEGADVGLFFYAGHGLQVKGINYLVATDAKLEAERDLDFDAVRVEFVLSQMEREAKTNIVFLDACRNNPLARNLSRSMGTRGIDENNGLAPIKSGLGTFIAFATQPGAVASDGSGRNSPFTAALKDHINAPDTSLTDVLIDVRKDVVAVTKGEQVPWDHSALQGRFYFREAMPVVPPPLAPIAKNEAAEAWAVAKDTPNPRVLEAFVKRFGDTFYGDMARARLEELKRQAVPVATRDLYFVDDARPPDPYLSLRRSPGDHGPRVMEMPNGTLLDVLEKREDGWWRVRVVSNGEEGWALYRLGERVWIHCCKPAQVLAEPQPTRGPPADHTVRVRKNISLGYMNLRSGPGQDAAVLARIPAGSGEIRELGQCREPDDRVSKFSFCLVEWNGVKGWVSSSGLDR